MSYDVGRAEESISIVLIILLFKQWSHGTHHGDFSVMATFQGGQRHVQVEDRTEFTGVFCCKSIVSQNVMVKSVNKPIEFSHIKPVNEFTEFDEFLLDTDGAIATCGQGFVYYPWKCTISGAPLFTLVVRMTCVRLDNLTI